VNFQMSAIVLLLSGGLESIVRLLNAPLVVIMVDIAQDLINVTVLELAMLERLVILISMNV